MSKILMTPGMYEELYPKWYRDLVYRIIEADPLSKSFLSSFQTFRCDQRKVEPERVNLPGAPASEVRDAP